MNQKLKLLMGIGLLIAAIIMLKNNIIWYYGWGGGFIFILWALIGDNSSPENKPRKIVRKFKSKTTGDLSVVEQVLSIFGEISGEWLSKKDPYAMKDKILSLKNMATTRIKYTYGNSLLTYFQVSFTKSKDTYMITFEGEGPESVDLYESSFGKFNEG